MQVLSQKGSKTKSTNRFNMLLMGLICAYGAMQYQISDQYTYTD